MSADAVGPDAAWEQAIQSECQKAAQETVRAENAATQAATQAKAGQRERIVLAERRNRRVVRTITELQDLTSVGETVVRELIRAQWTLSIGLMLLTVLVLAGIPLMFLLAPSLGAITILGLRLPWLLLGCAVYPFFVVVAWSYNRGAERIERAFVKWVEN